jgi:hypothetical protein
VRAAALLALLALTGACAPAAPETGSGDTTAHAHLAFSPASSIARLDVEASAGTLGDATTLGAGPAPGDGPLAPCSLASAAIIASGVNNFWSALERNEPMLPPPGTNILGKFDRALRERKIPRDNPVEASEILGRLYIWQLWGINAWANTFVARSTQQTCLDFVLSNPTIVERQLTRILGDPARLVYAHYAAVEHYSPTVLRPAVDSWLRDFGGAGLLARSSASIENPLAPCSLLRTLRMASRVNNLWSSILEGAIPPPSPGDPTLGRFGSALEEGTVPRDDAGQAMQIAARLFSARMVAASAFTERYLAGSTQQECLDEVFRPGLIRLRLLKEGRVPSPE